jgi:hypothetical protein
VKPHRVDTIAVLAWWVLAFLAVIAALSFSVTSVAGAATTQRALVYGDSLSYEASTSIVNAMGPSWNTTVSAVPGQSICNIRAALEHDLATEHPQRVTIQSHGNPFGSCMSSDERVLGSTAYLVRFWIDIDAMFVEAKAAGAQVTYVVDPPEQAADVRDNQTWLTLIAVYETNLRGARVAWGPQASLGGAQWKATQPCLASETPEMGCSGGRIPIRAGDAIHFCVLYPDDLSHLMGTYGPGCPTYSSGAYRFGRAIATATKI